MSRTTELQAVLAVKKAAWDKAEMRVEKITDAIQMLDTEIQELCELMVKYGRDGRRTERSRKPLCEEYRELKEAMPSKKVELHSQLHAANEVARQAREAWEKIDRILNPDQGQEVVVVRQARSYAPPQKRREPDMRGDGAASRRALNAQKAYVRELRGEA